MSLGSLMDYLDQSGVYGLSLLVVAWILGAYTATRCLRSVLGLRAARVDLSQENAPSRWNPAIRLHGASLRIGPQGLDRTMEVESRRLKSGLGLVVALVAAAPLLGLLGTVQGMTQSFFAIAQTGGRPDMANLADGIRLAMFTTLAGLLVALAGLGCHTLLGALTQREERALRTFCERYIKEVNRG